MRRCLTLLSLLGLLPGCGLLPGDAKRQELAGSAELANVPGEDSSMALLPGQGFNHIDWTPKGHCVAVGPLVTQSGQATGQFVEFRMLEVTSLSSLRDNLNITAAASFRAAVFGRLSARLNYARSINKNSTSRYLLVHTRVGNQLRIARDFSFAREALPLLARADRHGFIEQCGTEFIYGLRTGGEFFALFEFEMTSHADDRRFSAAMSASGLQWRAGGELNKELARFDLGARLQLSMYRIGGTGTLPRVDSLEEFARAYPGMVDATSSHFVTLELISKDYAGVKPLNLSPGSALLVRQDTVMNRLARNRDAAEEALNTIRHIQSRPEDFDLTRGPYDFEGLERRLTGYLNAQNEAAVNCFSDIFAACRLPTTPFPTLQLPARRWGGNHPSGQNCPAAFAWEASASACCRFEVRRVCALGEEPSCLAYENRRERLCQRPA